MDRVLKGVLLLTVIGTIVPFWPAMPGADLDPSWMLAVNHAVAQRLSFGVDFVYTYGPYGAILTTCYHPATDPMTMAGSLCLAVAYWAGLLILMADVSRRWMAALIVVLAFGIWSREAVLFSYPLIVGLATLKKPNCWLFAPFGLLVLVKGTLLIFCGAMTLLCAGLLVSRGERRQAALCCLAPVISTVFLWILSGQPLAGLPFYFVAMVPIAAGYTEAMSLEGNTGDIICFLLVSLALLLSVRQRFVAAVAAVFLFVGFKEGFVRHDVSHAPVAAGSLLLAAMLVPFVVRGRWTGAVAILSLLVSCYIMGHSEKLQKPIAWKGLAQRIADRGWPRGDFDAAMASMATIPGGTGTMDIYACNQGSLIASGNTWSPRPVFQSHSVYTAGLAEANRAHLLGEKAPSTVIFRIQPIDQRLPALEDGASWPVLLRNYRSTVVEPERRFRLGYRRRRVDHVLLSKVSSDQISTSDVGNVTATLGTDVAVPPGRLILAEIDVRPTLLGRAREFLFKPPQLEISLRLAGGAERRYRFVPGMARAAFVLSPLVENTAEFALFCESRLEGKGVSSFRISPASGWWSGEFTVRFLSAP